MKGLDNYLTSNYKGRRCDQQIRDRCHFINDFFLIQDNFDFEDEFHFINNDFFLIQDNFDFEDELDQH
ncbi:hypothetical protein B0H34DRAFT_726231, partial [Crassisporium funariophilum]